MMVIFQKFRKHPKINWPTYQRIVQQTMQKDSPQYKLNANLKIKSSISLILRE